MDTIHKVFTITCIQNQKQSVKNKPVSLEYSRLVHWMQSKQQKGSPLRATFRVPGLHVSLHTDCRTLKIVILQFIRDFHKSCATTKVVKGLLHIIQKIIQTLNFLDYKKLIIFQVRFSTSESTALPRLQGRGVFRSQVACVMLAKWFS